MLFLLVVSVNIRSESLFFIYISFIEKIILKYKRVLTHMKT